MAVIFCRGFLRDNKARLNCSPIRSSCESRVAATCLPFLIKCLIRGKYLSSITLVLYGVGCFFQRPSAPYKSVLSDRDRLTCANSHKIRNTSTRSTKCKIWIREHVYSRVLFRTRTQDVNNVSHSFWARKIP